MGTKSIRSADAFNFGVPPPSTLAIYLPHATGWLLQPQASYVDCGPRETGRGRDGHASFFNVTQKLHILLSLIHTALQTPRCLESLFGSATSQPTLGVLF